MRRTYNALVGGSSSSSFDEIEFRIILWIIAIGFDNYALGEGFKGIVVGNIERVLGLAVDLVEKAPFFFRIILHYDNIDWKQFIDEKR